MFENVLGQDELIDHISSELRDGEFPNATLFSGPRYSGKSTVALEIARVLTCRDGNAHWNCTCSNCRAHREYAYPELANFGPRDFVAEIRVSAGAFLRDPRQARAFLFVRAVRKLVRRFDREFWGGRPISGSAQLVESLNDSTDELLLSVNSELAGGTRENAVNSAVETSVLLAKKLPHDQLPVDLMRSIAKWARISGAQGKKVVVLEEAQVMQEASRNALLKILEEPPADTFFLLCSSRSESMGATLLSRLRRYSALPRDLETQKTVMERVFSISEFSGDLAALFRGAAIADGEQFEKLVSMVCRQIAGEEIDMDEASATFESAAQSTDARVIFEYLIKSALGAIDLRSLDPIARELVVSNREIVRRHTERVIMRNMQPAATFRSLLFSLGGNR